MVSSEKKQYFCTCVGKKVTVKKTERTINSKKPYVEHRIECPYCGTAFMTWGRFPL